MTPLSHLSLSHSHCSLYPPDPSSSLEEQETFSFNKQCVTRQLNILFQCSLVVGLGDWDGDLTPAEEKGRRRLQAHLLTGMAAWAVNPGGGQTPFSISDLHLPCLCLVAHALPPPIQACHGMHATLPPTPGQSDLGSDGWRKAAWLLCLPVGATPWPLLSFLPPLRPGETLLPPPA